MNTTLHVTIDKETKTEAARLAEEMGLNLSTIVKASLRTFVETKTFHVEKSYRMTPYLEKLIEEANKDAKKGFVSPTFENMDDALAWLKDSRAKYINGKRAR